MQTKDIIYRLRTENGLSQDELAEKVFVTRQAVSRWENGETVPNTDTLKLLSKLFDVSINTLLGEPQKRICQCCGMPLEDEIIGKNSDGTPNGDYCKWCYYEGAYTYSDMNELIDVCVKHMVSDAFNEEQARAYMQQLLPTLDYWKRYDELSDNGEFEAFKNQLIEEINSLNIEGKKKKKKKHISAISLNLSSAESVISAFLRIWILFWYAHMRKTLKMPSLYSIKKDKHILIKAPE